MTGALLSCAAKVAVFDMAPTGESKDNLLVLTVDVTRRDSTEAGLREVISTWGAHTV